MAFEAPVAIFGHVESTIYNRGEWEYVSIHGEERAVYKYQPGTSPESLKVIQIGESYFTVHGVPTIGSYPGTDLIERISHDISLFWTQLSSIIDVAQNIQGFDVKTLYALSDIMIKLAHDCGSEIAKEQSKSRGYLLEMEDAKFKTTQANQELIAHQNTLDKSKKTLKAFASALKQVLPNPNDKKDLLHQLSTEKDVIVTDLVKECGLNVHQQAEFSFFSQLCNFPIETKFHPIHVAALSGNDSIMKELYELDSAVVEELTGDDKMSVLQISAFGSLECFELCKSWLKPGKQISSSDELLASGDNILKMAAMGGNLNLLSSLISSPDLFSVTQFPEKWREFLGYACIGGHLSVLNWLTKFKNFEQFLSEDVLLDALSKVNGKHLKLDCLHWMMKHGLSAQKLITYDGFRLTRFQNYMASSDRADILEWLATLPEFELKTTGYLGMTLMHSACMTNSETILIWAFQHASPNQDEFNVLDKNGNHLVHLAAGCGSLDCLKWICSHISIFKHYAGSQHLLNKLGETNRTVLHFSVFGGDLATMRWLREVHGADYAKEPPQDKNGLFPIHYAWEHLECLKWMIEEAQCDLRSRDVDGWQLLHYAVLKGKLAVVDFIVNQLGSSSLNDVIPTSRRSAAHFIQSETMGQYLWKCGVNLSATDRSGKTLYDIQPSLRPWLATKIATDAGNR